MTDLVQIETNETVGASYAAGRLHDAGMIIEQGINLMPDEHEYDDVVEQLIKITHWLARIVTRIDEICKRRQACTQHMTDTADISGRETVTTESSQLTGTIISEAISEID